MRLGVRMRLSRNIGRYQGSVSKKEEGMDIGCATTRPATEGLPFIFIIVTNLSPS